MNELQQAEFALLKAFDQVCAKLGLKYFLVCGSALGAAKYRGFIPWDDDIDVALYREDYEIFCAHAAALLPEHLFVQNDRTDPAFPAIYSKSGIPIRPILRRAQSLCRSTTAFS